jgi:serine/threonine-protein kinase HipA
MNKKAKVLFKGEHAGTLSETDSGYVFAYNNKYLHTKNCQAVSSTLPLSLEPYHCKTLHPFFDGLIPEGWLLDIAQHTWKLNTRDRMSLLLTCCKDTIGAVSILPE